MNESVVLNSLKGLFLQEKIALSAYSTLKVGGPARFLAMPNSLDELILIQRLCLEYGIPWHMLSGGSNTLFSDKGFDGIVIKLGPFFETITHNSNEDTIIVGAAASYAKLTKLAVEIGIESSVGWSGIPGLVGGALRMNAGTRMGEIGDVVDEIYGFQNGRECSFKRSDLAFAYRSNSLPKDVIIIGARLSYQKDLLKSNEILLQKVQEYRLKRKQTQPIINSLGSFFKNPYPLFAAQLIESCQLKGLQYGGAQISSLHANFIINKGGATANEILYIGSAAQDAVFKQYGVVLQPEIRMVGDFKDAPSILPQRFSSSSKEQI